MQDTIETLSGDLRAWADTSQPIKTGESVPLFRLDQSGMHLTLKELFFDEASPESVSCGAQSDIVFLRQQTLSTGRLRSSFYPEIFKQHSQIEHIKLTFDVTGAFAYDIYQSSGAREPELFFSGISEDTAADTQAAGSGATPVFSLSHDIGKDARLYWSLRALNDDATLHDIAWQGIAPADTDARMVVVLRTFGRTQDILDLLSSFEAQASQSKHYRRVLKNLFFLVLDTSTGVEPQDYVPLQSFEHVTAHVLQGANMGGGGNMSQALRYLENALEHSGVQIDELLLLDDDLRLSLESLLRHWGAVVFRVDDTVFTLPVMMKSQPRRMWEDGALWGRFLNDQMTAARTGIAPRLLRHNRFFEKTDHLDDMAGAHYPEYCTFIFFSLPYRLFGTLGYPAAFFLRGDDIEYSLRHREAGGRILSNPNLCAWHEPGHSYGQEYMSIAHGVIINMRHGAENQADFGKFFYDRLVAHATIGDAFGLRLYAEILKDLNSKEMFLTHSFADRYVSRLSVFKDFDADFEYFSADLREDLRRNEAASQTHLGECSFLYPRVQEGHKTSRVLMENPHTGLFRLYDKEAAENITACYTAAADLAQALTHFMAEYDNLRTHYIERLEQVQGHDFWDQEIAMNAAPRTLLAGPGVTQAD